MAGTERRPPEAAPTPDQPSRGLCAARRLWQMRGMRSEPPEPSRWLAPLVLAAIVLLLLAGWFLFPRFQAYMARQDCIAAGHINCD
jgi:hypothetical protein